MPTQDSHTPKKISSNAIKMAGKVEIEQGLKLGQDLVIVLECSVVQIRTGDNHDGSVDRAYIVKATKAIVKEI